MLNEILDQMKSECNQLIEHLDSLDEPPRMEEIEVSFRQAMLNVGGRFVELYALGRDCGCQGKHIACSCGEIAEFQGYRPKTIQTSIGTAKIERAYYYCESCGGGFAPLDKELGITRRSFSKTLERMICRLSVVESFEQVVEDLSDVGGVSVSAKEAQLVSGLAGDKVAQTELEEVESVFAEQTKIVSGESPDVLCVELDGKIVPTRDGGKELKVAAISDLVPGKDAERLGIGTTTYLGRFIQACEFGRYVWVEAAKRGVERAKKVIAIGDGAPWIWNLVNEHFPEAVQILDFYHVCEHIWDLANTLYDEGTEKAKRFAEDKIKQIESGKVCKVIAVLSKLDVTNPQKQDKLRLGIGYLTDNKDRMHYPNYRKYGYHIGSGIVESACKQFGARLDQAGMRWIEKGAGAIAALRALKLSGRWDNYWKPARPPLYA